MSDNFFDLLSLPDDGIIAILRHVSLDDLGSIGLSCVRLYWIAREVFVLNEANRYYHINCMNKIKRIGLQMCEIDDYTNHIVNGVQQREFDRLNRQQPCNAETRVKQNLVVFGDLIHDLIFQYVSEVTIESASRKKTDEHIFHSGNQRLFEDVIENCSDELKVLEISCIKWTPELAAKAEPLLRRLTMLESFYCDNAELMLPLLKECMDLIIAGTINRDYFLSDYPKLKRLTLINVSSVSFGGFESQLEAFLVRHKNLRQLKLNIFKIDVTTIGHMQELEELSLEFECPIQSDGLSAFECHCLKKLILAANGYEISQFILWIANSAAIDSLEYLEIQQSKLSAEAVAALNRFNKLEILQLSDIELSTSNALRHFQNAAQLKQLVLAFNSAANIELPPIRNIPMPSLERINISGFHIGAEFIQALGRLPKLSHMRLRQIEFKEDVDVTEKRMFRNVNQLKKLDTDGTITEFLQYLGSTESLISFKVFQGIIDNDFVGGLCRYRNLLELEIRDSEFSHIDRTQVELRHLNGLKKLYIGGSKNVNGFLLHLGSIDAMESMHFYSGSVDELTAQAICSYRNVRKLVLEGSILPSPYLTALDGLPKLTELTLSCTESTYDWWDVFELVLRLQTIKLLKIDEISSSKFDEVFDYQIFGYLLEACRQQKRKIAVEFCGDDNVRDVPRFFFEKDNCQFVEVIQTLRMSKDYN